MDEKIDGSGLISGSGQDLMRGNRRGILHFSADQLRAVAITLYFSMPFIKWVIGFILPAFAGYSSILLSWIPIFILLFLQRGKMKVFDFVLLLAGVLLFFALTYLVHPEYSYWYSREYFGVWDYVLRPDNGLYAYLFLRLLEDPKKILKCLRISAFLCFIYYAYTFYQAISVGYWLTSWDGELMKSSYSLEFGYNLLLYALVFLYCALKEKKFLDWLMVGLCLFMILGGGSRGPLLDVLIFLVLFLLVELKNGRAKYLILSLVAVLGFTFYFLYAPILAFLSGALENVGISSRSIQMLLAGNISNDNGRIIIWRRAIQMIQENPFGYGAMGSRHVIYEIIHVGHPHNLFLEILIDYGVFVGGGLIIAGIVSAIRILTMKHIGEWRGLFLIFLGASSQLLLSGTYWHRAWIWALLSIGISIRYLRKRESVQNG